MGYTYTRIDGERVEVHVAAAFRKLEAAFKKAFGLGLTVASGTRTRAEQAALRDRYIRYRDHGGPWAPLAAAPGFSNHEESGPRGPRALDIWDTGTDAGVTTAGTKRANWLKKNAPRFGFTPAGYGFVRVEPWHYEFTGSLTGAVPASTTSEEDEMNSAQEKKLDALAKQVDRIDRRVHKMTGKALAYGIWGHNDLGAKLAHVFDAVKIGERGVRHEGPIMAHVRAVYNSIRDGEKGVRTHGTLTSFIRSELGAQKIFRAEQRGKDDAVDVEDLAESLAPLLTQHEADELAAAITKKIGAALTEKG